MRIIVPLIFLLFISKTFCSFSGTARCGENLYDPATQVCCGGVTHEKHKDYKCCSIFLYDPATQVCCGGTPHEKDEDSVCCGSDNSFYYYCKKYHCGCCVCWKSAPSPCFWGGCGDATPAGNVDRLKCPSWSSFKGGYGYC